MIKPIALIGFYGSGKTTLGRRVANELNMPFSELSKEMEKISGMRLHNLYDNMGESVFRKFESLALSSLAASGGVVVTTGGCIMLPYNRRLLSENFFSFYIDTPFELTTADASYPSIKNLTQIELQKLYDMRKPLYTESADHILDGSLPSEQLQSAIIDLALAGV